jgi:hypothetical protein
VTPQRPAARQPLHAEPRTRDEAMSLDGLGHVVGAGGLKPAASGEERRNEQLIRAQETERSVDAEAVEDARAAGGRAGREARGSPFQGW